MAELLNCTGQLPLLAELRKQAKAAAVDEKIAERIEEEKAARAEEEQIGRRHTDDHHRYCSVTPGLKAMPHEHDIIDNVVINYYQGWG